MKLSSFKSAGDNQAKPIDTEWKNVVKGLMTHVVREEKDGRAFSPAFYNGDPRRLNSNVEGVSCFVVDIDTGIDPEVFESKWKGAEYVIYSTHSNTKDCPKFRAVFPLKNIVLAKDWRDAWERFNNDIANGLSDPNAKDASRLYYLPSCPDENSEIKFARHHRGKFIDISHTRPIEGPLLSYPSQGTPQPSDRVLRWSQGLVQASQGTEGCAVARILWSRGLKEQETVEILWEGMQKLKQTKSDPWTKNDAFKIARTIYQSPILGGSIYTPPQALSEVAWDDVSEEPATFLWFPYLVAGHINLLEGVDDMAKGWISLSFAATVAKGGIWPDGKSCQEGKVVIFANEDTPGEIMGRLTKLGLTIEQIKSQIVLVPDLFVLDDAGFELVADVLAKHKPLLSIFDPILDYLPPGSSINDYNQMSTVFSRLRDVTSPTGTAGLHIRHHSKSTEGNLFDLGLGSRAIRKPHRSQLAVIWDADTQGRRIVKHLKHNYSRAGEDLAFTFVNDALKWEV